MENKFELREIEAQDLFRLSTIISKIGINQFKALFKDGSFIKQYKDENTTADEKRTLMLNMGLDIVDIIVTNIDKCEQPVYKFLAGLIDKKESEVQHMKGADFIQLLTEVFTKEEFKDFFKAALRSRK